MTDAAQVVPSRWVELVPLDELSNRRALRNPKAHDAAGIAASIDHHGVVELPTLDERTGRLVAGHGRLEDFEAKHAAGQAPPDGVEVDPATGRWLVPLVRGWRSRSDADAEAYLVYSNKAPELGGWKNDELAAMLTDLADAGTLELTGINADGLNDLLDTLGQAPAPQLPRPQADDDADEAGNAPGPAENPVTQPGDLWQLGPHRLLCGDSTVVETVDRLLEGAGVDLVLTDPPYAIYGSASGIGSDIADDRMVRPFFEAIMTAAKRSLPDFGHCYVHCDWRSYPALWDSCRRTGMSVKNCIVWDKGGAGLGNNYANAHEFILFAAKLPPPRAMASSRKRGQRPVHASNVMRFSRVAGAERLHNAAKPVALLQQLIENSTNAGARVLDLFGGSGSTLIAAQRAGRTCLMLEEQAGWCDVIARRYQLTTGDFPILVGTGAVDFRTDAEK